MSFLEEAQNQEGQDYPFSVRVMRDPVGRFFCQIVGLGMFDTQVNVTLPWSRARELGEAILNAQFIIRDLQ